MIGRFSSFPPPPRRFALGLFLLVASLHAGLASLALATALYRPEPLAVLEGADAKPWAFIERHEDPHPRFPWEPHHAKLVQFYPQTAKAFGTREPHSRAFLLYAAPGWSAASKPNPVLLLPGANDDATRRFMFPLSTQHPDHLKRTGLAPDLARRGFAVFAISFAHFNGCNLHQGEHVANAITRIRTLMGREGDPHFQVDLVTYSKGAMAARCYVQDAGARYGLRYLTAFRKDVRRIVFQVAPLAGLDTPFRYYVYNLFCRSNGVAAPLGTSHLLMFGLWTDTGQDWIHSGCWQGSLQMIHDQRLVGIPYGPVTWTSDANLTMLNLRDGGTTLFMKSAGLEEARSAGGNMVEVLNAAGLPREVSASIVAGDAPVVWDERHPTIPLPVGVELSGPSDGVVFVASSTYKKGLTARGAAILGVRVFHLGHIELSRSRAVYDHVAAQLNLH